MSFHFLLLHNYVAIDQNMYNRSKSFKVNYLKSHLIYKWRCYRQTISNQINIMVSYADIIGLRHSVAIYEKSMLCSLNVLWDGCASISCACWLWHLVNRLHYWCRIRQYSNLKYTYLKNFTRYLSILLM